MSCAPKPSPDRHAPRRSDACRPHLYDQLRADYSWIASRSTSGHPLLTPFAAATVCVLPLCIKAISPDCWAAVAFGDEDTERVRVLAYFVNAPRRDYHPVGRIVLWAPLSGDVFSEVPSMDDAMRLQSWPTSSNTLERSESGTLEGPQSQRQSSPSMNTRGQWLTRNETVDPSN